MDLTVFTPREFQGVFGVSKNTAAGFLSKNVTSGLFLKLRNGFYMISDSQPDLYLVANRLYRPSYLSLESALSHYNLIPETVYGISSLTTKATREFKTPLGVFSYQKIKPGVFKGYELKKIGAGRVLIAEPEKALLDYLYFVDLKKVSLNNRLELKNINKTKLMSYAKMFRRPGLFKLIEQIYAEYRQPRKIY